MLDNTMLSGYLINRKLYSEVFVMKKIILISLIAVFSCSKKSDLKLADNKEVVSVESDLNTGTSSSDFGEAGDLKTIYFDYDKATLTSFAKDVLKNNFNWLKSNPEIFIQIEGHCDNRGTIEYNLALGEKRALTVKGYLKNLGLKDLRVSTISYGEEKPLVNGDEEEAWAKNRRATFVIVSK